ncbi:MAG: Gfo/Idh/MocA family oxidoreductase [Dehalococcoidia bacterium]|nr:Gfo/Idh/MocA family oxidoreductase [Dehalococcoidia bacterium]
MAIGWGIVGTGGWADRFVAPGIRQAKDTKLVGIVSRDKARGQQFANYHGVAHVYERLEDMLKNPEIQAINVQTPNNLHAESVVAAAERGKHSICGIAMAATEEDCIAMVEACKRHKVQLGVDFQTRYHPGFRALKQVIDSGVLGDIVSVRCQMSLPWEGGARGNQVWSVPSVGAFGGEFDQSWKHDITMRGAGTMSGAGMFGVDMLRFLVGRDIQEVYAVADVATAEHNQENFVQALITFQGGMTASFESSNRTQYWDNTTTVYGTKGRASSYGLRPWDSDGVLRVRTEQGETVREFHRSNMFVDQIEAFNQCIQTGKTPNAAGVDGWRERQVTLAIRESAVKKAPVKIRL